MYLIYAIERGSGLDPDGGDDGVLAINLTRPQEDGPVDDPGSRFLKVTHHNGGPVNWSTMLHAAAVVPASLVPEAPAVDSGHEDPDSIPLVMVAPELRPRPDTIGNLGTTGGGADEGAEQASSPCLIVGGVKDVMKIHKQNSIRMQQRLQADGEAAAEAGTDSEADHCMKFKTFSGYAKWSRTQVCHTSGFIL